MSESLIPLSNLHFRHITHIEDDRSQVFLSQGAGHFLWRSKKKPKKTSQKNQMQGRCSGMQSTQAWMNTRSCSAKHFHPSHLPQNMTRFKSDPSAQTVCRCGDFCLNMHGLWRGFPEHAESEGGEELWGGGRTLWDVEGCVLTVRFCSSGLVFSSYRLTGRRRDVGVTVMEAECTRGQRDTETSACDTRRAWKITSNVDLLMLLETLAVLDEHGGKNGYKSVQKW